jgi:hypothetical protein
MSTVQRDLRFLHRSQALILCDRYGREPALITTGGAFAVVGVEVIFAHFDSFNLLIHLRLHWIPSTDDCYCTEILVSRWLVLVRCPDAHHIEPCPELCM